MKNVLLLFLLGFLLFSCSKDELVKDSPEKIIENRDSNCSFTFLGYDDEGCCIYRYNFTSPVFPGSKDGKSNTYLTVDNRVIKGSIFTVCETATVRVIREIQFTSELLCSSVIECKQTCDIDVTISDNDDAGECCWIVATSGITDHTLSIGGNEQQLTSDVEICICADEGETKEILVLDADGNVCFEDSVTCYECDECDQNYLSVVISPMPPENGMQCCYVGLKKEGPLYICDSHGNSVGVYPEDGATITGLAGSPATLGLKICREDWATTEFTGYWDTTEDNENICPRMEINFDLADCN